MSAGASAIGVDIGGTHLRAARVGRDGTILERRDAASGRDPREVLARSVAMIGELAAAGGVAGVGIGVPGQVDADGRRVLSGGFVDLSGLDVAGEVARATGLAVRLENDATMALIGEVERGAARGRASVVMLTVGTGIGGAILERGRVLRGRAAAGQLGHVVVDPAGRACVCGRRGCVETVSSGAAFAAHAAAAGLPPGVRAEDLIGRRDAAAEAVLRAWAGPFRAAVESLIAICDPELVVVGGGAGGAMVRALDSVPPARSWFGAPVVAAALGADAGLVGAGLAALGRARRAVLVNGVPASGKSGVAAALAGATGWPVLALDAVKEPFLAELAPVDREGNRRLGRASYAAMFDLVAAMPEGATVILDAWFGFQPLETLDAGLARAGIGPVVELWCAAPPEVIGARYAARAAGRRAGHPGADYVPELVALAGRARPAGRGPVVAVDTMAAVDGAALAAAVEAAWRGAEGDA